MRNIVQTWLMEEGYQISSEEQPGFNFDLRVQIPNGVGFDVLQEINKNDSVAIISTISIARDNSEQFNRLTTAQKGDFLWDLRISLLNFQILTEYRPFTTTMYELPETITVNEQLWRDGLTKDRFMNSIRRVINATFLIILKFQKAFGTQPAGSQPSYTG